MERLERIASPHECLQGSGPPSRDSAGERQSRGRHSSGLAPLGFTGLSTPAPRRSLTRVTSLYSQAHGGCIGAERDGPVATGCQQGRRRGGGTLPQMKESPLD